LASNTDHERCQVDLILFIAVALIPPGAILYGTVRAWRNWSIGWRFALFLPGALSLAAIAALVVGLSASSTQSEAGAFIVVLAYLGFLLSAAFSGGVVVLVHAARVASQRPAVDSSRSPANER